MNKRLPITLLLAFVLAMLGWFFLARDDRGPTSQLTADAWYYHAYLPSIVLDGDVDFENQYRITKNWYRFGKTPIGRRANVFGIGPAVFEAPLFAIGHGITRMTGGTADGFSRPEVVASLLASLFASLAALYFAARLLARRVGGGVTPWLVSLAVFAAGPAVYYAVRQPGYAHPFATFWVAFLVDHWDEGFAGKMRSARHWLLMGVLIGCAALARPQLALWAVLAGLSAIDDVRLWRAQRQPQVELARQVGFWLGGAVVSMVFFAPQLWAWKALYGSYVPSPQGPGFMRWDEPLWSEALFSSRNGLLPWAPIYALGFLGLVVGLRRHPRLAGALLVAVALQAIANGAAWDWWAGGSFGGRRFDSCFVAAVVGLAMLVEPVWSWARERLQSSRWRNRLVGVVVVSAMAAVLGSLIVTNLQLASKTSAPSARIYGGEPASKVLARMTPPFSKVTAFASHLANAPARWAFARRFDWADDYDRVVGVHQLGELFPGLNSFQGKKQERIALAPERPNVWGLHRRDGHIEAPEGHARILLGFNRVGPIRYDASVQVERASRVQLLLNGVEIAAVELSPGRPVRVQGESAGHRRGTNLLEIRASGPFELRALEVSSPVGADGR